MFLYVCLMLENRSEGFPGTGYVTPGCGGEGEGLGRPEFFMRRRRRCVRILAILPPPPPSPQEIIENKKNFPYGPFGGNSLNPDLAEKSSFPNGKFKKQFWVTARAQKGAQEIF